MWFSCIALLLTSVLAAQPENLVPNPSFEEYSYCPETWGGGGPLPAIPWDAGSQGTIDYFNACNNPINGNVGVPANLAGFQYAHSGQAYGGYLGRLQASSQEYKEYLMAPLTEPLAAGVTYLVSFYVTQGDAYCGIEKVGAYLSVDPPPVTYAWSIYVTPQIEANMGFVNDTQEWVLIQDCYEALGGEQYLTIGNFYTYPESPIDPACTASLKHAYYFVDDVTVIEATEIEGELDLGPPIAACGELTLTANIDNVAYFWNTGETTQSITVTTSGTYSVTITGSCDESDIQMDEVIVTILEPGEPVEIAEQELTLCPGDTYVLTLDPDAGEYTWSNGTSGNMISISTGGNYQVSLDDGCQVTTDNIDVYILEPPAPFTLGPDTILCAGDVFELYFDPELGDFLWHDGTTSPVFAIGDPGTVSLSISNACGVVMDDMLVTGLDVPDLDIGPDSISLCPGEVYAVEIDPAMGTILWQDGSGDPIYIMDTTGIYWVQVTNQCGSGTDQIVIEFSPGPEIQLGDTIVACEGDSIWLDAGPDGLTYSWQDGSQGQTLLVTTPGPYAVTVANACGLSNDSVSVQFHLPPATPDLGPDTSLCPGAQLWLLADRPGITFTWQDTITADSFLVDGPGTYTLITANACGQAFDTLLVTEGSNPPFIDLPSPIVLCQGQVVMVESGISGVDYLWSDGSTEPVLTVTVPGTYGLTVSDACGSGMDSVVVLNGGPLPWVSLGNDLALCPGEALTLSPLHSDVDQWLWPDGSSDTSLLWAVEGPVWVMVSNACGMTSDTILISLLPPAPVLDLGPDTSLCLGASLWLATDVPDADITWPDGSSGQAFEVTDPGMIVVLASNACGTTLDTLVVTGLSAPVLDLGPDQALCPGESIIIDPGLDDVTYAWQDGSTEATLITTQPGTYSLTVTNTCGWASDTLLITESTDGPLVDLGVDQVACEGDTVILAAGISGVMYTWQDGSVGSTFQVTQTGTYILQVSNQCGMDADTVEVVFSGMPPAPSLGPDTTACEGDTLWLWSFADSGTLVSWQDGSMGLSYAVSQAGLYVLTEENQCGAATDSIVIEFRAPPGTFSLGQDTTVCPGDSLWLEAPETDLPLTWQDGSTLASLLVITPGVYSLSISNECGLQRDEIEVRVEERTPLLTFGPTMEICPGEAISLDATQAFEAYYSWSTGDLASSITVVHPGVYQVHVTTSCAEASGQVQVIPAPDCVTLPSIGIPNVFSPNGDGLNDVFAPSVPADLTVRAMQGAIYDRWGNLVFSSRDNPFSWDGRFQGEILQPAVFVYALEVEIELNGQIHRQMFSGDVTLVR